MDAEVPAVLLDTNTEKVPFDTDRWAYSVMEEEERGDESLDEAITDDDDDLDDALRRLRQPGPLPALVDDPGYCYLCDGQRTSTSAYAREIVSLIDEESANMSIQAICRTIQRYYVTSVQPITRRRWSLKSILLHITRHCINPGIIRANNLRILRDYQDCLARFSRSVKAADGEEVPPDPGILSMQLKVVAAISNHLRSDAPAPKRARMATSRNL